MKRFTLIAAMLAIAASCTVTEIDNNPEVDPILGSENLIPAPDITASYESNDTKTTLTTDETGVGTVWWTSKDEINVFYGTTSTHYVSHNTENETITTFSSADMISTDALDVEYILGLYPYDENAECDGYNVKTSIPAAQEAVAGTFDEDIFTSLGRSEHNSMIFYNVLGGLKFNLSRDDISSITFNGNNNEDIAGKVSLSIARGGFPSSSADEGENTITLTPKGRTTFKSGEFYYIVMLPTVFENGFTIAFTTIDGKTLAYNHSNRVEIKRSGFKVAREIDKKATELQPFTITSSYVRIFPNGSPETIKLEYCPVGKNDWHNYELNTTVMADYGVQFRAIEGGNASFSKDEHNYYSINTGPNAVVSGNIMSLLDANMQKNTLNEYEFYRLFDTARIKDASELQLPATTLAEGCYRYMFGTCQDLIKAPAILPATTLAKSCYDHMFFNCTSLTSAPALPATTLASDCYFNMFDNCTSLTSAPALPATNLAYRCYYNMFHRCNSLTIAPALPATKLADFCYYNMFSGCTSLTTAPELPATTLAGSCYSGMFEGCTSLTTAPELPATTLAYRCYVEMFERCGLTTAPELPATNLAEECYKAMFCSCFNLTSGPAILPATKLAERCYYQMFYSCPNLTTAPALPATELDDECYREMFYECPKLLVAPDLPATKLKPSCYESMFYDCQSLKSIKVNLTAWNNPGSSLLFTKAWLYGVPVTGTFSCPGTLDTETRDDSHIPEGWNVVYTSPHDVGEKWTYDGIEAMYVGNIDGKQLLVATKNLEAETIYDEGTSYTRAQLEGLTIPDGWELPTAADMTLLGDVLTAQGRFEYDSTNDGAYYAHFDYFVPFTQDVADSKREGRIWVVGGGDEDFFWFRSDGGRGVTTTHTDALNYQVRLVKKL